MGKRSPNNEAVKQSALDLKNLVAYLKEAKADTERRVLVERYYDLTPPNLKVGDLCYAEGLTSEEFYCGCEELTIFVYKGTDSNSSLGEKAMLFNSQMHDRGDDQVQFRKMKKLAASGKLFKLVPKDLGSE